MKIAAIGLMAGAILVLYSPALAAVVVAALAINLAVTLAAYPAMRRPMEEEIVAQGAEQSHLMENVRAAAIIELMGGPAAREATSRNPFASKVNASFSMGKFQIGLGFAQTFLIGLQTVIIVFLAARANMAGDDFSIGMLFAFMSFRQTFSDLMNALAA